MYTGKLKCDPRCGRQAKRLGNIQEAEIESNKHFKGKIVASRIDLNTPSGDLFFMLLIKRKDPFFALLSPLFPRSFPGGRKDGMRLAVPSEQWLPFPRHHK